MTCREIFVIGVLLTVMPALIDCRILLTQGADVATTPAGGRSCATVCQTPLLLAAFPTTKQLTSYACTAQGVPGFQAGAGASTCTVAVGASVMETPDYSCLCLAPSQIQGLSKPDATGSCDAACPAYAGQLGTPVVGSQRSLCLAQSEAGTTNRFGYVTPDGCKYAAGTTVQSSSAFSCVCAYGGVKAQAPAPLDITTVGAAAPTALLQKPQAQLPTAG